ncbi:hypothetical protein ACFFWC_23745 [Plantactinospora siamensis]|uniref:DUF3618 domain-containing protein n=1 Tax=Plantactinospora siamensis TaxID=555372 RepID=A0ABV6P4Z7_9ACTN
MTDDAWQRYVAAAQRLAAVRRGTAAVADERSRTLGTTRDRLAEVRERLAPQRSRLRALGVPEVDLVPSPPEAAVAARAAGRDPGDWSAALRQAGASADSADALLGGPAWGAGRLPAWLGRISPRRLGAVLAALLVAVAATVGLLVQLLG